jgi:hypothetical protein
MDRQASAALIAAISVLDILCSPMRSDLGTRYAKPVPPAANDERIEKQGEFSQGRPLAVVKGSRPLPRRAEFAEFTAR